MPQIVTLKCPVCRELTPHETDGAEKEEESGRKYQTMTCKECGTSTKVYTGEMGDEFQPNVDLPDNTDLAALDTADSSDSETESTN